MFLAVDEPNVGSDVEKDTTRVSLLSPAKLTLLSSCSSPSKKSDIKQGTSSGSMSIELVTWLQIACGLHHTVGLTAKGCVYTFGSNQFGQLGTEVVS